MKKLYESKITLRILIILSILIIFFLFKSIINRNKIVQVSSNKTNLYKILVDVEDSKMFVFENEKLIKTYKCSGGKSSTPSPIGNWTIISKSKWGEGFRTEAGWD